LILAICRELKRDSAFGGRRLNLQQVKLFTIDDCLSNNLKPWGGGRNMPIVCPEGEGRFRIGKKR
jgi:hypothetical protein